MKIADTSFKKVWTGGGEIFIAFFVNTGSCPNDLDQALAWIYFRPVIYFRPFTSRPVHF